MRNHTLRLLSTPTSCSRFADVDTYDDAEFDENQDVYAANDASPVKMIGTYESEQDRCLPLLSSPTSAPTTRNFGIPSLSRIAVGSLVACTWIRTASAVKVAFDNCLDSNYIYSNQLPEQVQLQWVPLYVDAKFDTENPNHNLIVTVWGNVTGRVGTDPLPPWNSSVWDDPSEVLNGKIQNEPEPNLPANQRKVTTLYYKVDVSTYEPYHNAVNFCGNILNGSCPLGPVFKDQISQ